MSKPSIRALLEHYGIEVPDSGRREIQVKCPVHDENRPSCSVNEDEQLFHCMACGAAGDAYTLVMLKEACDFGTAQSLIEGITGESHRDIPRPARRRGSGLPGQSGAYRPRFRRPSARRGAIPDPGP